MPAIHITGASTPGGTPVSVDEDPSDDEGASANAAGSSDGQRPGAVPPAGARASDSLDPPHTPGTPASVDGDDDGDGDAFETASEHSAAAAAPHNGSSTNDNDDGNTAPLSPSTPSTRVPLHDVSTLYVYFQVPLTAA